MKCNALHCGRNATIRATNGDDTFEVCDLHYWSDIHVDGPVHIERITPFTEVSDQQRVIEQLKARAERYLGIVDLMRDRPNDTSVLQAADAALRETF